MARFPKNRNLFVMGALVISPAVVWFLVAVIGASRSRAGRIAGFPNLTTELPRMSQSTASFKCPHCGKSHEGSPTDYGYTVPDVVWSLPKKERDARAKWSDDVCEMGERRFIRCVLSVRFTDREGDFGWGVWVEVERPVFERYLQMYNSDAKSEPAYPATLANQPPAYDSVIGAPVTIQFGTSTERPRVSFPPDSTHVLAIEQEHGITSERYHQILEAIGAAAD